MQTSTERSEKSILLTSSHFISVEVYVKQTKIINESTTPSLY